MRAGPVLAALVDSSAFHAREHRPSPSGSLAQGTRSRQRPSRWPRLSWRMNASSALCLRWLKGGRRPAATVHPCAGEGLRRLAFNARGTRPDPRRVSCAAFDLTRACQRRTRCVAHSRGLRESGAVLRCDGQPPWGTTPTPAVGGPPLRTRLRIRFKADGQCPVRQRAVLAFRCATPLCRRDTQADHRPLGSTERVPWGTRSGGQWLSPCATPARTQSPSLDRSPRPRGAGGELQRFAFFGRLRLWP